MMLCILSHANIIYGQPSLGRYVSIIYALRIMLFSNSHEQLLPKMLLMPIIIIHGIK